jgi:hypothetical protein
MKNKNRCGCPRQKFKNKKIRNVREKTMKTLMTVLTIVAIAAGAANAAYTEGFEGSGYNFYADTGCTSGVTTAQAYSGSQSAEFVLNDARFAYTRWKSEDISSYGFKLKDIAASAWEKRTVGRSDLAPYFLFTIATPDTSQETLAIQFSMPTIADNVWSQNIVNSSTIIHVSGDRTGLLTTEFSPSNSGGSLAALAAKEYSSGVLWGDFAVTYVRIGVGLWDAAQAYTGYADNVTVTPEPTTMALLGLGGLLFARKKK